jgi:hypothetical protein
MYHLPSIRHQYNIHLDFVVLTDMIPRFAMPLSPAFATVREELLSAIYSDQLTLSPQLSSEIEAITKLEKIPWFSLLNRLGDKR